MHFSGSVPGNYNYSTALLFSCFLCFLLRRFSNDIHSISTGKTPTAPLTWSHPRVPHKLSQQSRQSACSAQQHLVVIGYPAAVPPDVILLQHAATTLMFGKFQWFPGSSSENEVGQQENEKCCQHMFHIGLLAAPLRRFRAAKDQDASFAWLDTLQMRDISFHSAINQHADPCSMMQQVSEQKLVLWFSKVFQGLFTFAPRGCNPDSGSRCDPLSHSGTAAWWHHLIADRSRSPRWHNLIFLPNIKSSQYQEISRDPRVTFWMEHYPGVTRLVESSCWCPHVVLVTRLADTLRP